MQTQRNNSTKALSKKHWLLTGAFLLLLILGSKIDLDFGGLVSFTLQTLFLGLAYYYLPRKFRFVLILVYLLLGLLGLHVFNGGAGWSYFSSYPFGFFVGFVLSAFISSPTKTLFFSTFAFFLVIHLIILSLGILWLAYYATLASAVQTMNSLVLGMVIKSLLGAVTVALVQKYVRR